MATRAVMAPDTATVSDTPQGAQGPFVDNRRRGMRRRFADEDSLTNPDDLAAIRNHWYPVHFASKLAKGGDGNNAFALFGEEWELVKATDAAGAEAAKTTSGEWARLEGGWVCRSKEKVTPDEEGSDAARRYLPIGVQDGLVMVWPGTCTPDAALPTAFEPPSGYTIHAELVIEDVPVEHGLLMENLLDLAHAPFTHTGTFAKVGCVGFGDLLSVRATDSWLRREAYDAHT